MIKQLLHALIDNSVKYTPAGGDITLSCAEQDNGISISVADTGIGMEPEHWLMYLSVFTALTRHACERPAVWDSDSLL
jgi:signal transduction histidine kinase